MQPQQLPHNSHGHPSNQETHKKQPQFTIQQKIKQGIQKKNQLKQKALQLGVSISHLKKQQRKNKWQQLKLIKRKQKRQKERQKRKENKKNQLAQKQLQNQNNQQQQNFKEKIEENSQNQNGLVEVNYNQEQKHMLKRKDQYREKMKDNLKVVIDLQFYDEMTQKQLNSLIKQLSYCHAINRKMQTPFNFILTSVTEQRSNFIDTKYNGKKWGITMLQQSVDKAFKLQDLVYLTGDAQQQIQQYDQTKIYIIGGIVDHNRLKKITYNYAKQHNIVVKRLPLKQIKLKTNVHLAVNHVWEWMLRKYNGQTWDQSLQKVLPQRKIEKIQK